VRFAPEVSGVLSPPSPPADKSTARQYQAGKTSTGDRARDSAERSCQKFDRKGAVQCSLGIQDRRDVSGRLASEVRGKIASKNVCTFVELSSAVPSAENETTVPSGTAVRTKGDPKDAEQDPPATRPTQFALDDPGPMLVNVKLTCESPAIVKKLDTGRLLITFLSVAVVPLRAAKVPVLAGPMTFESEKLIPLEAREIELSPIFRVPASIPDGTLILAEKGD
jgi:hypothetical protein